MKHLRWALFVSVSLLAGVAAAQPSATDKETARALLLDGRAKLEAKDYAGAYKSLQGAHAIMNVPTTGIALAKAQAALGQLVEARETALAVARMPVEKGESGAFADARAEAATLADALGPRIPSVTVIVIGPDPSTVDAKINGATIVPATLGLPRKVNPGHQVITLAAPGYVATKTEIDLAEREARKVQVELTRDVTAGPSASAPPAGFATTVAPSGSAPLPTASNSAGAPSSATPAWAWIAGGAGLAAIGVGAGFFADYFGVRDTIARDCPGNVCDPKKQTAESAQSLRAQWNRDIGLTIGLGAAGLVGIGVAIVGLTRRPAQGNGAASSAPHAVVRVRGTGLAVEGAF